MANIQRDLMKKKHVRKHPFFANKNKALKNARSMIERHAQELSEEDIGEDLDMHGDAFSQSMEEDAHAPSDKKLPSLVKASIKVAEDIFSQFDFPLPPKISYNNSRDVKYSNVNPKDVISGIVILNCKIATVSGMSEQFEVPVSVVRSEVIPPSVLIHNGRMPIIAQSTIDAIVQRSSSYELPPVREMYSPPMNREEREMFTSIRNELGWQPRDLSGLEQGAYQGLDRGSYKAGGTKEATRYPVPAAYAAVIEKMEEAEEAGDDTFPRAWQHILMNYILKCVNTVDKDKWEVHLINDGWAINPWARPRRKGHVREDRENDEAYDNMGWELLEKLRDEFENYEYMFSKEDLMELTELFEDALAEVELDDSSAAMVTFDEIKRKMDKAIPESPKRGQVEDLEDPLDEGLVDDLDEEEVEEIMQRMYNGTSLPMEINDNARFPGGDGQMHGKIVEINPDNDTIIIKSKGTEYRIHCDEIEPLNSTYKNKYSKKKAQDTGLNEILNKISLLAVDGHVVDLDSEDLVYIGLMWDDSGYVPGAAMWISDSSHEDLQDADEVLREYKLNNESENYDPTDESEEESWNGTALAVSPEEFIEVYNSQDEKFKEMVEPFIISDKLNIGIEASKKEALSDRDLIKKEMPLVELKLEENETNAYEIMLEDERIGYVSFSRVPAYYYTFSGAETEFWAVVNTYDRAIEDNE